jgi:hypothetical protein
MPTFLQDISYFYFSFVFKNVFDTVASQFINFDCGSEEENEMPIRSMQVGKEKSYKIFSRRR